MTPEPQPPLFNTPRAPTDTISEIKPHPRNINRMSIKVGKKCVATLSIHIAANLNLTVGQPWDQPTQSRVNDAARYDKALSAALNMLNRRPYSTRELGMRLRQKGHPTKAVDQTIHYLTERQLLDDAAFGRELIRQLTARGPAGPRLLRAKLFHRGIPEKLAQTLLDENTDDNEPSLDQAIQFARRKINQMAKLDPNTRRRRIWGALARKGYDSNTIDTIVRAAGDDTTNTQDES